VAYADFFDRSCPQKKVVHQTTIGIEIICRVKNALKTQVVELCVSVDF